MPTAHCPLPYEEEGSVLCRPGDDLLSHVLRQSTIGAKAFDGRVRDGIGSLSPCKGHQAGKGRNRRSGDGDRQSESKVFRPPVTLDRSLNEAKLEFSGDRPTMTGNQKKIVFRF